MGREHIPVLVEDVLHNLVTDKCRLFIDATVGGAGHSRLMLERYPDVALVGIDADEDTLKIAKERLLPFEGRATLVQGNFRNLKKILEGLEVFSFDAILFDLGLSTYQLEGNRGFSFHDENYLDMRMDKTAHLTAYHVVNTYNLQALKRVLEEYGEEGKATKIAKAILEARKRNPIRTAIELNEIIWSTKRKTGRISPATQTFQAVRIEVNNELDSLRKGLDSAIDMLPSGGRIGVISFHSLEDRIVKETFKTSPHLNIVTKKPLRPGREEARANPRSRSAKFRVAEKR